MGPCENGRYSPEDIKKALRSAGVFIEGHFIFAGGDHSFAKVEMNNLWRHPRAVEVVLNALTAGDLPAADVILGVPTGGQRIVNALKDRGLVSVPVVQLERVPGGTQRDFRFCSEFDRGVALSARSPRIYEDVVTTLGSVASVVGLLNPELQDIHAFAVWRRGKIRPEYTRGVTTRFLVEEEIPSYLPEECPFCS